MITIGASVSKSQVCKRSGAGRTFLYSNPDLLELINNASQNAPTAAKSQKTRTTDEAKDLIIESLKRRNALLERENKELLRGKIDVGKTGYETVITEVLL